MAPNTCYAEMGDLHIAYQTLGEGPPDLILVTVMGNVEGMWDIPPLARSLEHLAAFGRLILFDIRGTGLSDPVALAELPTLEQRMDDIDAVMDAAGSEQAVMLGIEYGGPAAVLFAATHPRRTQALVLADSAARLTRTDDYPVGWAHEDLEVHAPRVISTWGTPEPLIPGTGQLAGEVGRERWGRYQRQTASPGVAAAIVRMSLEYDVHRILPSISVPTLVLSNRNAEDPELRQQRAHSRYLADHIPGATYVEVEGPVPLQPGDLNHFVPEIREFVTGVREVAEPDRVLTTVLFSDIVGSTERATALGDHAWRDLLDAHDDMTRRQLQRYRGREVKTTGDGFLATFDGPARAIRCAAAIREAAQRLGIQLRLGIHTGEVELRGDDVGGIAVHIAARVAAHAGPSEVLVSRTVTDLVAGSEIVFQDRGEHALKGVAGDWQLFAVAPTSL
jgi:class 3 adenylate cyclase/pimeloyl-ACP methyl ester carboxylesterase